MAQEFSWSRLLHAVADVWVPTKGIKDVIRYLGVLLPIAGYAIFASLKPEMLLPPSLAGKIALVVVFLFVLAVLPVRVAYRLRCQLDALLAIPESDRNLILELKAVAGEAVHHCTALLSFSSKEQAKDSTDRLRTIISKLRLYTGIYNAAVHLSDALAVWSITHVPSGEYERMMASIEPIYKRVLSECDSVIKPTKDPALSRTSEQAPPS